MVKQTWDTLGYEFCGWCLASLKPVLQTLAALFGSKCHRFLWDYVIDVCMKIESPVKYSFELIGYIYVWVTFTKSGSYYNWRVLSPEEHVPMWSTEKVHGLDLTIEFLLNELFCKMSLVCGQFSQPLKMASVEMFIKKAFISHIANNQTNIWTFFSAEKAIKYSDQYLEIFFFEKKKKPSNWCNRLHISILSPCLCSMARQCSSSLPGYSNGHTTDCFMLQ